MAGFSFADETEAGEFLQKVNQCKNTPAASISAPSKPPPPKPEIPASTTPPATLVPMNSAIAVTKRDSFGAKDKKKKKSSLLGGFSKMFGKDDEDEEELIISEPSNFRHESSIGWNVETGFEVHFPKSSDATRFVIFHLNGGSYFKPLESRNTNSRTKRLRPL